MITYLKNRLPLLMRMSLGICYFWFGILKFFPDWSPAEGLARDTIDHLVFSAIPAPLTIHLLAGWEVLTGLGLMLNIGLRWVLGGALLHMLCTFTPFIFYPELCFRKPPVGFSLAGQYIMKNLVFIAAMIYLWPERTSGQK